MPMPDRKDRVAELLELEDERDRLEAERKEAAKEARQEINRVSSRIYRIRQILQGKEPEELPGTGGVHLKREHDEKGKAALPKKFPQGADLSTPCGACGRPLGDHAGTKCPPSRKGEPIDDLVGTRDDAVKAFKKARKAGSR